MTLHEVVLMFRVRSVRAAAGRLFACSPYIMLHASHADEGHSRNRYRYPQAADGHELDECPMGR